jgi:hypothetical protein
MTDFKDDFFISLSDFVEDLSSIDYRISAQLNHENISQTIENISMETACQLQINVEENGKVSIGAIPPMYYLETSVMPVFHNIKLKIELDE